MAGCALTALRLTRFRSHEVTRIAADARPVAIFGANGAGKTNVLEAVSLLSPGRGLRGAGADEIARRPGTHGWKVAAEAVSLGQVHEVETWAEPGGARQVRIDGKAAPQVALGRLLRVLWLTPAMDRLWIEGAEGRRRFLDRMVLSLEPGHAEAVLSYDKAMRERNRLLKDDVTDPAWYGALETRMAVSGAQVHANRVSTLTRVGAAQEGAETAFPAADLELLGPDGGEIPEGEEALARAFSDGRGRDRAAGRALTGPHRADLGAVYAEKGAPVRQCSTGEQKALLISLVLANARALDAETGAAPILLLDEVAAHLDATRRAALHDEIAALGAQAWMTGTGRELFEDLGDRAQSFEMSEEHGVSRIAPV